MLPRIRVKRYHAVRWNGSKAEERRENKRDRKIGTWVRTISVKVTTGQGIQEIERACKGGPRYSVNAVCGNAVRKC